MLIKLFITAIFMFSASCSFFQQVKQRRNMAVEERPVNYFARPSWTSELRQRIIVLPFLSKDLLISQRVKEEARKTVVRELFRSRRFVIVRNSDFPVPLSQFLNEKNEYNIKKLSKLAANMGVAALIEGKILNVVVKKVGDEIGVFRKIRAVTEVNVQVRAIATRNGKEILRTQRKASVEAETTKVMQSPYRDQALKEDPRLIRLAVQKAFRGVILHLVKSIQKLDWEGRVAMVSGEKIYINAGRLSGIQIGDILKVTEEGKEVYDPETGRFLGRAPGRLKGTIEIISYFGKDGAIGVVHSGSGFKENDRVELY
ncbi:MAG: hypothetical protein D6797_06295 [Bdellovibrio sp.]|nr:MAG: hypothetical protein D6797_06295 [Bdellovibrio sp.]